MAKNAFYFLDYELIGEKETGLSHILALKLQKRSILVTSRYDESEVRKTVEVEKIKLLPKGLSAFLPIRIDENKLSSVLIDDQTFNHSMWLSIAAEKKRHTLAVYSEDEFYRHVLPLNTPIYVDRMLKDKELGEDVLSRLHSQGYTDLYLYTGDDEVSKNDFPNHPFIREVHNKGDIFEILSKSL